MDEYLFIAMAKLKADRLRLEREQGAPKPEEALHRPPIESSRAAVEVPVMRKTLTLTASVAINVVALALFGWSVSDGQLSPQGEVTITQIEE